MSEYVPTTEDMLDNAPYDEDIFYRWLATVKADAWDECLDEIEANYLNLQQARSGNPYRWKQA
jgi:hypothetical protein